MIVNKEVVKIFEKRSNMIRADFFLKLIQQ